MLKLFACSFLLLLFLFSPVSIFAQAETNLKQEEPAGIKQVQFVVERVVKTMVYGAFMAVTIMMVVAGLKFLTSGGDAKQISGAQQTITWAALGVLFLVMAFLIIQFIATVTGNKAILDFDLTKIFPS